MTDFDNHWLMMSPTGVSFNRDEMYVACRLSWDAALASRDAAVAGLVSACEDVIVYLAHPEGQSPNGLRLITAGQRLTNALAAARTPGEGGR